MTTPETPAQRIRILSEIPQVTYPRPGEPETVIALNYLVDTGPPRTVFIAERVLPDVVFRRMSPEVEEIPAELVRQGDAVRRAKIRADIERRRTAPASRTLEV